MTYTIVSSEANLKEGKDFPSNTPITGVYCGRKWVTSWLKLKFRRGMINLEVVNIFDLRKAGPHRAFYFIIFRLWQQYSVESQVKYLATKVAEDDEFAFLTSIRW